MSVLRRFFEARSSSIVLGHPGGPSDALLRMFQVQPSASGVEVTREKAVGWTPIAAGVRLIAESIASLPLNLYEALQPRGNRLLVDHPLYRVLHAQPNGEMTSFEYRELCQHHMLLWGNSYSQVVMNGRGNVLELWPLNPDRVRVERDRGGALQYRVSLPRDETGGMAGSVVLPASEVLHIRGPARGDGLLGDNLIWLHREAIGLGLATEEFGARFFGQGANAGGFLEHPGTMSELAQDRLRKSIDKQVGGLSRAHRLLILEEGMKWHQTTVEPEKAQFLGLRKFQLDEASRILRIPPHMLGNLDRATFSNIEHQALEFVVHTLRPWLVRWEQRIWHSLLGRQEQNRLYAKFVVSGLLRGDTTAQWAGFTAGLQNGVYSINDVRELLDMNPIENGDTYHIQVNLAEVGHLPAPAGATGGTGDEDA